MPKASYGLADVPSREGFLTEPLAAILPSGPFPEFTWFEARALDCIASICCDSEDAIRGQISCARAVDRVHTVVGFYTRVEIDRSACSPVERFAEGKVSGHFVVEDDLNLWVILWGREGYLECIEGTTAGDEDLDGIELADLRFVRFSG